MRVTTPPFVLVCVTGRDARVLGCTNVCAATLDLVRDTRWGRLVGTYGEEPCLTARLGVEMVQGLQLENVTSTLKHFAVDSVPKGGRDGEARFRFRAQFDSLP